MFMDLGSDEVSPMRLQLAKRTFLIGTHQPAVASHICSQDGGEAA
jgi:hypothetical protein